MSRHYLPNLFNVIPEIRQIAPKMISEYKNTVFPVSANTPVTFEPEFEELDPAGPGVEVGPGPGVAVGPGVGVFVGPCPIVVVGVGIGVRVGVGVGTFSVIPHGISKTETSIALV